MFSEEQYNNVLELGRAHMCQHVIVFTLLLSLLLKQTSEETVAGRSQKGYKGM